MRRPLIAGNWKMHTTAREAVDLVRGLMGLVEGVEGVDIMVAPPFVYLQEVGGVVSGSPVALGAQDLFWEKSGAWTGEVSAVMLRDVGCEYVIVGHSERRQHFHETDEDVNKKVLAALDEGLRPIVCVGETLTEREEGVTIALVSSMVRKALEGVGRERATDVIIAYEPLWAIGTGRTATPAEAEEVHRAIRNTLLEIFGPEVPDEMRILYGGSVKPGNIDALMAEPDIDGALVGGASLEAESFARIVRFEAPR